VKNPQFGIDSAAKMPNLIADLMNFQRAHNDFFPIFERHLDPRYYGMMAPGEDAPGLEVIEDFEQQMGLCLPDDFKSFSVSRMGGVYVEVKEEFWPPSKEFEVRPAWAFMSGLYVYGFGEGIPPAMDIRLATQLFKDEQNQVFAPCLQLISDSAFYGFHADGTLALWDPSVEDFEAAEEDSFIALFERQIQELAERQKQMMDERDNFTGGGS